MRISEILDRPMVLADVGAATKDEVLGKLAEHVCTSDGLEAPAEVIQNALLARERLGSTGVGEGVAIPHAKISGLAELIACFARAPEGVQFDAIDQKPVTLIFVLLVPENSTGAHLKALARISRLLRSPEFRKTLLEKKGADELYDAFVSEDGKH